MPPMLNTIIHSSILTHIINNILIEEKIPIIITSRIENGDLFYIKENFHKNHKDVEVYK